ncbi:MAG: serine--tRNA ligase [bacterium]
MLDLRFICENIEAVREKLSLRNGSYDDFLKEVIDLSERRRELINRNEGLRGRKNRFSGRMVEIKRSGGDFSKEVAEMKAVSREIKQLDERLREVQEEIRKILLQIPNLPDDSVPEGQTEYDNQMISSWGEIKKISFKPKSHDELGVSLGILDFQRAAKISGARFCVFKGLGARLERALASFMLDLHVKEHGYTEIIPPYLVNADSLTGTGQLPKFDDDLFSLPRDGYYLIPTAEVPVTNLHRDEILAGEELPLSYVSYTPCFRREAGSYGKDTKGIIRQHQFHKVELVKFVRPDNSYEELERLLKNAEEVLRRLELPYRVVNLCGGDLGFSAAKTFDIEVWLPSQNRYREISSCSNFTDFQARRANLRFREKEGKPAFLHTLNGSALAVGRTLVAVLENYQQEDGTILMPKALRPYLDEDEIKPEKDLS